MILSSTILHSQIFRVLACAAMALACLPASAQQSVPNAMQGFAQNKDAPVKIEAASLEVRDKDKVAIFSGDVSVTQGDMNMRCKSLEVYYEADSKKDGKDKDAKDAKPSGTAKAAQPGPGGSSAIKRLLAKGGVVVKQKDQTATGDSGIFDMKSNSITLEGKVTVTQGQNVLRGERLVVDMASGEARFESGKGRVEGLFVPAAKDGKDAKDKDSSKTKDAGKAKTTGKDDDAVLTRPATRDAGAAPERSRPVAPRGIY